MLYKEKNVKTPKVKRRGRKRKGKEKKKGELYSYHERKKNKKESFYTLLRISGSTDTNMDHGNDTIWIQKKGQILKTRI